MYDSIVVGTDGSASANEAVRHAASLAALADAHLHVVMVTPGIPVIAAPDMMVAAAQWSDAADAAAKQSLDDAAAIARELGAEVTPHQRGGDPADQLLDVCEETDADLLVVGNRGMHGARRFLLGSVSSRCAHHANTSVLVVQTT